MQLLLALARGNRSESLGVDTHLALADAQALYRAGEARLGTNEDTFINILTTRSAAHLNCTFQYYQQTYGHSFEKVSLKPYYYDVNNANIGFYFKQKSPFWILKLIFGPRRVCPLAMEIMKISILWHFIIIGSSVCNSVFESYDRINFASSNLLL